MARMALGPSALSARTAVAAAGAIPAKAAAIDRRVPIAAHGLGLRGDNRLGAFDRSSVCLKGRGADRDKTECEK